MTDTATLSEKQTKDMENLLPQQIKSLYQPELALKKNREDRLRKLLVFAKEHSSWYRVKLASIDPNTFTEERLPELPTLDKKTLMENWDEIVTDRKLSLALVESHIQDMRSNNQFLYLLDCYRLLVTSGSSGLRGIFIYDWDEWNTYYLMFKRYRFYNQQGTGSLLSPLMKKTVIAAVVGTNPIHSIYSLEKSYKTRSAETVHFSITAPMDEIIEGLNHTQPDVLLGSSSTIHRLSKEVHKNRLDIHPKVISVYGEPFYPPVREAIEKTWPQAGIFNTYGTSEGLSASYCRANSTDMHLNDDLCIVEPVDSYGNPVPKEIMSKNLYITNLFNRTLPLIRYEIHDEMRFLDKKCSCGSHFQLISELQNRPDFDFNYSGDIFVNHVIFAYPLLGEKQIKEFQVVQTENGAFINLLINSDIDLSFIQKNISEQLKTLGLTNPELKFNRVENFEYPASGKLRRFIPL